MPARDVVTVQRLHTMSTEEFARGSLPPAPRPNLALPRPSLPPSPNLSTARGLSKPSQPPSKPSKPGRPLSKPARPPPGLHLPTQGGTSRHRNGPHVNSDQSVCRAISHGKALSEWLLHFPAVTSSGSCQRCIDSFIHRKREGVISIHCPMFSSDWE